MRKGTLRIDEGDSGVRSKFVSPMHELIMNMYIPRVEKKVQYHL
jgi:hypothetical protein